MIFFLIYIDYVQNNDVINDFFKINFLYNRIYKIIYAICHNSIISMQSDESEKLFKLIIS